ncbi:MAG: ornithine cyclodeaminase [Pseudomonadota bacterium]
MSDTQPSKRALVPFVNVKNMMKIVNQIGLAKMISEIAAFIEADYLRWEQFDKTPRVASHSTDGVIELMPTSDGITYGFKFVNGHPANMVKGLQTVTAFGVLASVESGYPVLFSEMTILTALRTAAMSAVAAKYLAPKGSTSMAIIGNGAQCEFQCLAFQTLLGIDSINLYDIDPGATRKALRNLDGSGLKLTACASAEDAVLGVDIITTCTADKQFATILTDNMVGIGQHINAIGGDCPGKTELHKDILLRSNIFVEHEPQTRIEGEIQQLPPKHPVKEIWKVISGEQSGRQDQNQLTLFDGVGFATEDFSALRYVREILNQYDFCDELDIIADPDDPRDLFGMVRHFG